MNPKLRSALWALLALGLVAAALVLAGRAQRESRNRSVELVFDYAALRDLARAQDKPLNLADWPTKSLAFGERKLDDLESQGIAVALEGLQLEMMRKPQQHPNYDKTYLLFLKPAEMESIQKALQLALGQNKVRRWSGDPDVLEVDYDYRLLPTLGLGFPSELIGELAAKGYNIWLRPENKPQADAQAVELAYQGLSLLPNVQGVIFGGSANQAVGYPQGLDKAAEMLERLKWKIGLIELMPGAQQKGIEFLTRLHPEWTVRVFAVPPAQQEKLTPDRVVGMYSLAARERNLRVLYVRPYAYNPSPEKEMENANAELLAGLQSEVGPMLGQPASRFEDPQPRPNPLLLGLVALGAAAATWLLIPFPLVLGILLLLGLPIVTAATAVGGPDILLKIGHHWRSLTALGTACVLPTLAMVSHFPMLDRLGNSTSRPAVLIGSLLLLVRVSCLSLTGALMAASFLSETSYMLGLDTFRGVKLLTLGVPILVVMAWLVREQVLLPFLATPLRLYHVAGLAILGILAVFYVLRTGNMAGDAGGEALEYEKHLRLMLDQALGVRPRFKEFMLGHPALMLCPVVLWLRWRPLLPLVLLAAAIGQAGMADTFGHIHTPLQVSLIRSGLGVLVGAVVGTVAAAALLWLAPPVQKWLQQRLPSRIV